MKALKKYVMGYAWVAAILTGHCLLGQATDKLWYDEPASQFEEALLLGNGRVGATVLGGVFRDEIYLNDATLWSGGPVDPDENPDISALVPRVREALEKEDYRTAEELNSKIQGRFTDSYAPLGTLIIAQALPDRADHYYRELDIANAEALVRFNSRGTTYTREYLVTHPDSIIAIRLSASEKRALNLEVGFESQLKYTTAGDGADLDVNGYAPSFAYPSYMGKALPDPVRFDKDKGTRFSAVIRVKQQGGQVSITDSLIKIRGADEAVLYIAIATSFNGYDKDPVTAGRDSRKLAMQTLNQAYERSFEELRTRHRADYRAFFDRVRLQLNDGAAPEMPTDDRLKRYNTGEADNDLEALYFQFGRYLLIASSRTTGVPANLQGIWNPYIRPPWSSNYTMNINAEENYWLAENANLSEMHRPFLTFIENLAKTGRHTARAYYGVERGWAAGHNSDIWALSNPVGEGGKIDPRSCSWNMGGTWAVTHLWEHFMFTQDTVFLRQKAYPLMKGAALFCLDWMVRDKDGKLITSPATSPEAQYITPDGFAGATLYGGTSDMAMIRECLLQTLKAAELLDMDMPFQEQMRRAISDLLPYKIGHKGNLQEWYYDWEDEEPQHRHQSHLYGLYPGHHLSPEKTPELCRAAMKTLDIRGDRATGWSTGWRINLWARLKDGNRAYKIFRNLLTYVQPAGAGRVNYSGGGGTYPNLMDAHPPFQIDGNFGGAAGVIEMLLQSDGDSIELLPALPDAWQSGMVRGIVARGAFEISMSWKDGSLEWAEVLSKAGMPLKIHCNGKEANMNTHKGDFLRLDSNLEIVRN